MTALGPLVAAAGEDPISVADGGVFAAVIAVAYWLIRRSDSREKDATTRAHADLLAAKEENQRIRASYTEEIARIREGCAVELLRERESHERTRQLLYEALVDSAALRSRAHRTPDP